MNIGLLYGGKSTEHEISIITMLQIKSKLEGYNVYCLYMSKQGDLYLANNTTIEDYKILDKLNKKFKRAKLINKGIQVGHKKTLLDSVVILNHGKNGEDGLASALLEYYDIAYVGSDIITSAVLMDKGYTHSVLVDNKILVTNTISYFKEDYLNDNIKLMLPCIIKPATLGSSIGISVCKTKDDFEKALELAFSFDDKIVIEELLENFLECNIAAYKTKKINLSKIEVVFHEDDILTFKDKYETDYKLKSHNLEYPFDKDIEERIKQIAIKAYQIFNCEGIVRLDLMIAEDKIYVNEINTIPGALAYYLFDNFEKILEALIKQSIIKKQRKARLTNSFTTNVLNITSIKK